MCPILQSRVFCLQNKSNGYNFLINYYGWNTLCQFIIIIVSCLGSQDPNCNIYSNFIVCFSYNILITPPKFHISSLFKFPASNFYSIHLKHLSLSSLFRRFYSTCFSDSLFLSFREREREERKGGMEGRTKGGRREEKKPLFLQEW